MNARGPMLGPEGSLPPTGPMVISISHMDLYKFILGTAPHDKVRAHRTLQYLVLSGAGKAVLPRRSRTLPSDYLFGKTSIRQNRYASDDLHFAESAAESASDAPRECASSVL